MEIAFLAFTNMGEQLARRITSALGGTVSRCGQNDPESEAQSNRTYKADDSKYSRNDPASSEIYFQTCRAFDSHCGQNDPARCIPERTDRSPKVCLDDWTRAHLTDRFAKVRLDDWTRAHFKKCQALIYIGAAGIAVRAIAPYVKSKMTDPAVLVVDERGQYVIPILSGHIGGANELAKQIAEICGARPVITTATDINGIFAVDTWALRCNCMIRNPEQIKKVSSKLLNGEQIHIWSDWPVTGKLPEQVKLRTIKDCSLDCDVRLTLHPADTDARQPMSTALHPADTDARQQSASSSALILIPRILVLGIGCRKGTTYETLESFFQSFMEQNGFAPEGIFAAASVDIKASEPGLTEFCSSHGWPLNTYPASLLQTLEGDFSTSEFVREITGTDNVCERCAVYRSKGTLVCRKTAGNGVTMALAAVPFHPDWEK